MEARKSTGDTKPSRLRRVVRTILVGGACAVLAALTAREVLFHGPYRTASPLPEEAIIDLHCHAAGLGAGGSGCFVSKELRQSYKFDLYLKAFGTSRAELEAKRDAVVIEHIARQLAGSRHVGAAVVLAIDGVVNTQGDLDLEKTETYVPNEFIAREVARHTNLLFGASINPLRHDAIARLDWAATNGAVLVKWIPPIMQIDPADDRITPFYQRMRELKLPLLVHTGFERTFTRSADALGDPQRLRLPLSLGVTVIAAHVASTGEADGAPNFDRLRHLMAEFPNLHADISALTQINRLGALRDALAAPECEGRLVYGTDYPLMNMAIVSPWYFPLELTRSQMAEIAAVENPWDRDVALKQSLGVPAAVFQRARELLPDPAMSEQLELRTHGTAELPTLIYLPGLQGDWTLITRFRMAVNPNVRFVEMTYPRTTTWTLRDHAQALKSALLERAVDRGWLLAESFGSQVAWEFVDLAAPEFRVEGLILAGGFARHPWPRAVGVASFLCQHTPLGLIRAVLSIYAAMARFRDRHDPVLQQSTREFLERRTEADRKAATHRLDLTRHADGRVFARRAHLPVYQLCGFFDLTVFWPAVRRWLQVNCPGWRESRIIHLAEHAVLVTAPDIAARMVLSWMGKLQSTVRCSPVTDGRTTT